MSVSMFTYVCFQDTFAHSLHRKQTDIIAILVSPVAPEEPTRVWVLFGSSNDFAFHLLWSVV